MSEPKKYRKLPVVIEAMEWDGTDEGAAPIQNWAARKIGRRVLYQVSHLIVQTLEGDMRADPGDYIIEGVNGEFYPCKPDIFEKTYEAVE